MSTIDETATKTGERSMHRPYDQFLLFGDSITEFSCHQGRGFALHPALQDVYMRKLDVVNRGLRCVVASSKDPGEDWSIDEVISGYTTANALKVFPDFFPSPRLAKVRILAIFFGANDSCLPGNFQHVHLNDYKRNLRHIIQHPAMQAQNPRILIITPPPINEYQQPDNPCRTRSANHTKLYADAAREVAGSLGVPVVNIWSRFMNEVGWREGQPLVGSREVPNNEKLQSFFTDGLHLSPDGYKLVFDEIMNVIRVNWPDQTPEQLPRAFPGWLEAPK